MSTGLFWIAAIALIWYLHWQLPPVVGMTPNVEKGFRIVILFLAIIAAIYVVFLMN